jgi:hypothetical protein
MKIGVGAENGFGFLMALWRVALRMSAGRVPQTASFALLIVRGVAPARRKAVNFSAQLVQACHLGGKPAKLRRVSIGLFEPTTRRCSCVDQFDRH